MCVLRWLSRVDLTVKCFEQEGHVNGFSPVWIRICLTRSLGFLKLFGQCSHLFRNLLAGYSFNSSSLLRISLIRSFSAFDSIRTFWETVSASNGWLLSICSASSLVNWMIAWLFGCTLNSEFPSVTKRKLITNEDQNSRHHSFLYCPTPFTFTFQFW